MGVSVTRGQPHEDHSPETPDRSKGHAADCRIEIDIKSDGDVNIYNCCAPRPRPDTAEPERPSGAIAPGQCVPLAIGSKPKQSLRTKTDSLLENTTVPSAIAAAFFQHARRFLAGRSPANPFETEVFGIFEALTPDHRSLLACSVASFDGSSPDERGRLFDASIAQDVDVALDAQALATAFSAEVAQRVGTQVFGDPQALDQERPGRNRFFDPAGVETFEAQLRVCTINGLRTNEFSPGLGVGDYMPSELEQDCTIVIVDGEPKLDCQVQVQHDACPGNYLDDGTCLRVPEVLAGEGVVLEGVNFISVDAKVHLTARPPGSAKREVDTFVYGDLDTPVTEVVEGQPVTIRDCRVRDKITFVVPEDLPAGVYAVQVTLPNVTGFAAFGDTIVSNPQYIRVAPSPTARFNISAETIYARMETSPASFGSDEIALSVLAVPILDLADMSKGPETKPEFRFDDMDTGEWRNVGPLFNQQDVMEGLVMTILGFEVDNERAYREMITDFWSLFVRYLVVALVFIGLAITAGGGVVGWGKLAALALAHPILAGVAVALLLAGVAIVAAWAPADPVIEDSVGLTLSDLDALTSVSLPMPEVASYVTHQGIKVRVTPEKKNPTEYLERRSYRSEDEDSLYELVLRYNRVA